MMFDWSEEPGPWNEWKLFDVWRENYDSMSLEDQSDFHREFYKRWTVVHQHGDDRPVVDFFEQIAHEPVHVLEIGGWDGAAAARILPYHNNILEWRNVEFTKEAVEAPVCKDGRYHPEVPTVWPWETNYPGYEVLFMQHVIEHMKHGQFEKLLQSVPDARWVFIQSPLDMEPRSWKGYPGCHILEVGWTEIDLTMERNGYTLAQAWWDTEYSTAKENGRTRIYMRVDDAV